MLYVHFETLGCKLNQIESESMAAAFSAVGFAIDNDSSLKRPEQVALCIVNTCTVTGKAEQKARRIIRMLLKAYPAATVLVTGCYAQVEPEFLSDMDDRIAVVRGGMKGKIAELPVHIVRTCCGADSCNLDLVSTTDVARAVMSWEHVSRTKGGIFTDAFNLTADDFFFHSRASIKVQDGCNSACAYCRICIARGPSVSLDSDTVIRRIQGIEAKGWNEVVLTGVNLSQYKSGSVDFAGLLARALKETSNIRFRISSLYPERIDAAFLDVVQDERVCPHFHLSIQSGSPKVLRAMRRADSVDRIYKATEALRTVKDNPFLACDIITGFPGETDQDFELTLNMCRDIAFAGIHAFPFSPRPGTPAWSMTPRVPERVAGERLTALTALAETKRRAYVAVWQNKVLTAITEQSDDKQFVRAVTGNYLDVRAPLPDTVAPLPQGSLVTVKINTINTAVPVTDAGAIAVTGDIVSI